LQDASSVHAELRRFIAIELNYRRLSERARELVDRLAAFRIPVPVEAAEWVLGAPIDKEIVAKEFYKKPDLNTEVRKLGEQEFILRYKDILPEQRLAKNLDQPIAELIAWGLLTPIMDEGDLQALSVHSLVRDFCREQSLAAGDENWQQRLRDAAAFYTNQSKLISQDEKTPAVVWSEMEAFELLMEAGDFEKAASVLINEIEFLRRWGMLNYLDSLFKRIVPIVTTNTQIILNMHWGTNFGHIGRYDESLEKYEISLKMSQETNDLAYSARALHGIGNIYLQQGKYKSAIESYEKAVELLDSINDKAGTSGILHQIGMIHELLGDYGAALDHYQRSLKIDEELGDRAGVSKSLHQIGMIHEERGDYGAALEHYQQSLKIKEELGDRAGVALTRGQMGSLFTQLKRYPEALEQLLLALKAFKELGSPNAQTAVNVLKELRKNWGAKNFDAAWQHATGEKWEIG
jgi:tetratricopeptide (TPR) repeat protein